MSQRIAKGHSFVNGDIVTAQSLNDLSDNASFVAGAGNTTDDSSLEVHTDGYLKLKDGGVQSSHLASDAISDPSNPVTITNNNFTTNSIDGDNIVNNSLSGTKIESGTITATQIQDGTITSAKLDSGVVASLGGSFTSDEYDGVKMQSSGIQWDPPDMKIWTTKSGRLRTVVFELRFENSSGQRPLLSVPGVTDTITFLLKPASGKTWDWYDMGTAVAGGNTSKAPYGNLRYITYSSTTYIVDNLVEHSAGYVKLYKDSTHSDVIYINIDKAVAGNYLQQIEGSITFPTAS